MNNEIRPIPDIMMDVLKDYGMIDGGRKPLLEYIDEIMKSYTEMEKSFNELTLWQEDMKKDMREIRIAMKKINDNK